MPPQYQQEHNQHYGETQKQSSWVVPFSIIIAGALVGAGIYMSGKNTPGGRVIQGEVNRIEEININPITSSDHILGSPNAKVILVEFSDTECPYCKAFHTTLHRLIDEYGKDGRVAWVYRHFPIPQLHSRAPKEAQATECANELGGNNKFWEYIDTVFARTESNDTLDPAELPQIAEDIGLDPGKFNSCLNSNKYADLVLEDSLDAQRAGAKGTPYTVLIVTQTGEKIGIDAAQSYDTMRLLVEEALNSNP